MTEVYKMAYGEVEKIIALLPKEQKEKIPNKILMFLAENKNDNIIIKKDIPLEEQDITKEAKAIVANIYRDYLAENDKREKIILKQNQDLYEEFNVETILKNRKKQKETQIIEYRKSIFENILGKIKSFLHLS